MSRNSPTHHRRLLRKRESGKACGASPEDAQLADAESQVLLKRQAPLASTRFQKRSRPEGSDVKELDPGVQNEAHIQFIPDEILLMIFAYLSERDLCRIARVCKRFQTISNEVSLWKRLYIRIFEGHDVDLEAILSICRGVPSSELGGHNPWKRSLRLLYKGINVRVHLEPYVLVPKITLE